MSAETPPAPNPEPVASEASSVSAPAPVDSEPVGVGSTSSASSSESAGVSTTISSGGETAWAIGNDTSDGEIMDAEVVTDYTAPAGTALEMYDHSVLDAELVTPESEAATAEQHRREDAEQQQAYAKTAQNVGRAALFGQIGNPNMSSSEFISGLMASLPKRRAYARMPRSKSAAKPAPASQAAPEAPAKTPAAEDANEPELRISPEEYADVTNILKLALKNNQQGPSASPYTSAMLEVAIKNVAEQNEAGDKMVEDVLTIEHEIKQEAELAAMMGHEELTYPDIDKMYNLAYLKAYTEGRQQDATDIMRRRVLMWALSSQGLANMQKFFEYATGKRFRASV